MRRLTVLTWHTHGSYLYYLSHAPHEFFVLARPGRPPGYGGRCGPFPFGPNVHDLPVEQARERRFDCILFQEDHHWQRDQHAFLTPAQRALPRIYLEHDPPGVATPGVATPGVATPGLAAQGAAPPETAAHGASAWPTDLRHPVDDPDVLLVHVTPFNRLMWDCSRTPTRTLPRTRSGPPAGSGQCGAGDPARAAAAARDGDRGTDRPADAGDVLALSARRREDKNENRTRRRTQA
jgi:hypothetical protein